jgi:hypothetical protein
MLLILDDNGSQTRKLLQGGALDDVIIKCRHYKINIIQLAQRYTQLSPTMRVQSQFIIFFAECNPNEKRNIWMMHGVGGNKEEFWAIIDSKTRDKFSWIPTPYTFAQDGYL